MSLHCAIEEAHLVDGDAQDDDEGQPVEQQSDSSSCLILIGFQIGSDTLMPWCNEINDHLLVVLEWTEARQLNRQSREME